MQALKGKLKLVGLLAGLSCVSAQTPVLAASSLAAWVGDPAGATGAIPPGTQTLREIISPRVTGDQVRLTLTNRLGLLPVTFTQVWIGVQKSGAELVAGSNKQLTFGGSPSVTIAPGETVTSDMMSYPVVSFKKLAISMQAIAGTIPAASETHSVSREINYFSLTATAEPATGAGFLPFELTAGALFQASWHYINELDVVSMEASPRVVVCFGDSITDGLQVNKAVENTFVEDISNLGREQRYEDYIQGRLSKLANYKQFSFVNAGIAGNRLTAGPFLPFFGPSALDRVNTDVIKAAGVTDAIVGLGINDIAFDIPAQTLKSPTIVTTIETDLTTLINQLHSHRIRVVLTTILPALGAEASQFAAPLIALNGILPTPISGGALHGTEISDQLRRQVNTWISGPGSKIADAVVDLSSCMANPKNTSQLNPIYDSGDHLHPNAAGYMHMANACTPIGSFGAIK